MVRSQKVESIVAMSGVRKNLAVRGKEFEVPAIPAMKCFFFIFYFACLAAFCLCISAILYCLMGCWLMMNSLMVGDVSLLSLWRHGLSPFEVRNEYHFA